ILLAYKKWAIGKTPLSLGPSQRVHRSGDSKNTGTLHFSGLIPESRPTCLVSYIQITPETGNGTTVPMQRDNVTRTFSLMPFTLKTNLHFIGNPVETDKKFMIRHIENAVLKSLLHHRSDLTLLRFILALDHHGKPTLVELGEGEIVASLPKLIQMLHEPSGLMVDKQTLIDLAQACYHNINEQPSTKTA
ncbi:MAG: hypothetical protein ACRDD3_02710, partial [Azovibrio sp.]